MSFAQPALLVVAAIVAGLFALAVRAGERRARAAALEYSSLAFLGTALGPAIPWAAIFTTAWVLAILAGGAAFAKPSWIANVPARDGSVVLCIDTSGSMASTDVVPSRIAAARTAARAFLDGLPPDTRFAVVAFSSAAVPLGPLVADREVARDQLTRLPAPNGATAIGTALDAAAQLLPTAGRRAIVLVTDGVNNRGLDPLDVAQAVGARGIAIFTVGIGTNGSGAIVPGTSEAAGLDEDALRTIAQAGGGSYSRVANAAELRSRLDQIAGIAVLERRRVDLSLPFALGAGLIAFVTALAAVALGRFP